jgi:hypothetical protein
VQAIVHRLKRSMGESFDTDAAEKVMHYRVADDDDPPETVRFVPGGMKQFSDQAADLSAYEFCEGLLPLFRDRILNAAHHIATMTRLRVQRRPHGQNMPCLEIEQLCRERSSSEVNGYAKPLLWGEDESSVIGQNRSIPLPQFKRQIVFHAALAGQPPSFGKLLWRESRPLGGVYLDLPVFYPYAAASATPLPPAGKLYSIFKQEVAERSPFRRGQLDADRLQRKLMDARLFHKRSQDVDGEASVPIFSNRSLSPQRRTFRFHQERTSACTRERA